MLGTVDLTSADPPPTPPEDNGKFYANTTAGTVLSAPWPAVSDLTTGQAVSVGNIVLWNGTNACSYNWWCSRPTTSN